MKSKVAVLALALLVASCTRKQAPKPLSPEPSASAPSSKPRPAPSSRTVAVRLTFDSNRLHVRVTASGPAPELRSWRLGEDAAQNLNVRGGDDKAITFLKELRAVDLTGDARGGPVSLDYDVTSSNDPGEDVRSTRIEKARLRCTGERMLALPAAFDDKALDAVIEIDASGIDLLVAGSTFGGVSHDRPKHVGPMRGAELRRAAFVAGAGGHAEFDAPEGHDEALWIGYTAFDPRAVAAEVAGFRGVLHDYFHAIPEMDPSTLIFAVDARQKGTFRAIRRAGGELVAIGGTDAYDAPLRLAVANELVHAWIGERIWIGDASPGAEAQTAWFHDGVARWVAREQLTRVGLVTPDEYAAEVNRLLSILATSPKASLPVSELLGGGKPEPGAHAVLTARGALWATQIDARIRDKTKGKQSLDDAIKSLATKAAASHAPLPADALDSAIEDLGLKLGHGDFDDIVATGKRTKLSDGALGECFEPREATYDIPAPGFDVGASRRAGKAIDVDPKGPAAAAGLKEGDTLVNIDGAFDKPDEPVRIEVARPGGAAVVTYKPTAGARRGQSFKRKPDVSESGCKKMLPRH
jgi:hypothetical protein